MKQHCSIPWSLLCSGTKEVRIRIRDSGIFPVVMKWLQKRQRYICIRSSVRDTRDGDRLLVFDAKTEKYKTISKKSGSHMIIANMLFYVEVKKNLGNYKWRVALKSCKLDGSAKKVRVKSLDIRCDGEVTIKNNSIIYTDIRGRKKTMRFGASL